VATTLLLHVRQEGLDCPELREHVHVEDPLDFLGRLLQNGMRWHYAHIINQHRYASNIRLDPIRQCHNLIALGNIAAANVEHNVIIYLNI